VVLLSYIAAIPLRRIKRRSSLRQSGAFFPIVFIFARRAKNENRNTSLAAAGKKHLVKGDRVTSVS
jgi:hypothetical protein